MNQILVKERIYVTPTLKKKKTWYKIQCTLCIIAVIVLIAWWAYGQYVQIKGESKSQELLVNTQSHNVDNSSEEDDTLIVAMNDSLEDVEEDTQDTEEDVQVLEQFNTVYTTSRGTEYRVDSILNIPSLEINYPVLSDSTDELLKIALNKFWGGEANSVGNYCIVGHNYDGKDIFFGKLHKIQNGDIVELQDKTGTILQYKVYNKFIVNPNDVACTSQLTNGKKEMTLITCSDGGKSRLVVKCRAVE